MSRKKKKAIAPKRTTGAATRRVLNNSPPPSSRPAPPASRSKAATGSRNGKRGPAAAGTKPPAGPAPMEDTALAGDRPWKCEDPDCGCSLRIEVAAVTLLLRALAARNVVRFREFFDGTKARTARL